MEFHLCVCGGAGGHWLPHLIYLLENNKKPKNKKTLNFHNYKQSKFVFPSHYPYSNIRPDSLPKVFLNGSCSFNIYLNNMIKHFIIPNYCDETEQLSKFLQIMKYEALGAVKYSKFPTDIDYNLIFLDEQKFIDQLFTILDKHQIKYYQNKEIALESIKIYRDSCISPEEYFANYNNLIWLGWCLGVLLYINPIKYEDLVFENFEELKNLIRKHHRVVEKITDKSTIFF
jgi:hypothetical protein